MPEPTIGNAKTSESYLSLTAVAKIAPGRPTANAVWRWCRRGVKARGGERVRLQHIRIGGMIYTTARWLEEFGRALAEADAKYFDLCEAAVDAARVCVRPRQSRRRQESAPAKTERAAALDEIDRELDAEGV